MALRTSKFILARDIRMDKSYKNVLNYSESAMVTLLTAKSVASGTNLSFIRPTENYLDLPTPYGTALTANYLGFQNPDYANKWFFAFIESVEYVTDGTTRVHFTIDEFSTWFDNWTPEPCFIVREHVNDDTVGANTVPEGIEHGEYISNGFERDNNMDDLGYIVQATNHYNYPTDVGQAATDIGGIYNVGTFWYFPATAIGGLAVVDLAQRYSASATEKILNVYVVPSIFVGDKDSITQQHPFWNGMTAPVTYNVTINKTTTLDGYTPRNKKLLIGEYNFLVLDNNNGTSNVLRYEDFSTTNCVFEVEGVPTCGGSIKCVPKNYKGATRYQQEGIMAGKFPVCGWANDNYTNWLTQQSVNINQGRIGAVAGVVVGGALAATGVGATAGGMLIAGSVTSLAGGVLDQMREQIQHTPVPTTASGNINGGDIATTYSMNKFYFIHMTIKAEYARQIDDFFDRFGYRINRVKTPNITGRTYWNYVEISKGEDVGFSTNQTVPVPPQSMETINNIFRNGVTIWHGHDNIGNFALSNTIVQQNS